MFATASLPSSVTLGRVIAESRSLGSRQVRSRSTPRRKQTGCRIWNSRSQIPRRERKVVPQGELSISDLGSGLRYYLELQPSEPSRHKFLAFRQGAWSECCALP